MYLTIKRQSHLSKDEFFLHTAKKLYNQAVYNIRQFYFQEKKCLNYQNNYTIIKTSENYKLLNSNTAQQILKEVDGSFKSFFGLLKLAKKGKYNFKDIKLPNYLQKNDFTTLVIGFVRINTNTAQQILKEVDGSFKSFFGLLKLAKKGKYNFKDIKLPNYLQKNDFTTLVIGFVRINKDTFIIPYSNSFSKNHKKISIKIPPILLNKKIKEIQIKTMHWLLILELIILLLVLQVKVVSLQ